MGGTSSGDHGHRTVPASARLLAGTSLATLMVLAQPMAAPAADWNWDSNRTVPGNGGAGTWNLTNQFWSPNADGTSGPYQHTWDNSALDNAIFGGTAGTVTLGAPITVHDLTFNPTAGFVLSGGTLTLGGSAPTITTNTSSSGTTTIGSVIAGTQGLVKDGTGTLELSGVNTFSGDISLLAGTLYGVTDSAFGAASNNISTAADVNVTLRIDGVGTARSVTIGDNGTLSVSGAGVGSALISGNGNVNVLPSNNAASIVRLTNDNNTYTGSTTFHGCNGVCSAYFSSIGNLNEASSLGAPITEAAGTIVFNQSSQYTDSIIYIGDGDSSNRNWDLNGDGVVLRNQGTGTLTLTGAIDTTVHATFSAEDADIDLEGVLSGNAASYSFSATAPHSITLGGANTFGGDAAVGGLVHATTLADIGSASAFGAGTNIALSAGTVSYTGTGASSNRVWIGDGASGILNDGSGALTLSGGFSFKPGGASVDSLTLGGSFTGTSTYSGIISGTGSLISDGDGTWVLGGPNTFTGSVTVNNGTLQAGNADAFGAATGFTVNGGRLDLGGFDLTAPSLTGTGGVVALGGNQLTVKAATAQTYGGSITGTGGLAKTGAGTLTLTGASTYSGATTVGGGTLALDFSGAGGPTSDIISSSSPLILSGGSLDVIGAAGETDSQSFAGTTVTAGSNTVQATEGAGGSVDLDLGALTRTGGLVNFVVPGSGAITTDNADGALGGWATINGSDYAKVEGGAIVAFDASDYTDEDDAGSWAEGQVVTDTANAPDSPFFGTVAHDVALGGLRYTAAADSTVTIDDGVTLGVDGTIIVAPSVGDNDQTITGGSLTGGPDGGVLGFQQNSAGTFTIASTIVNNGGATSFAKGGTGTLVLTGINTYTGTTTLTDGTLRVSNIGNGGAASNIGASTNDSANLVLEGGDLQYTGGTATTDRGFTLVNGGLDRTIEITNGGANLTFTGKVTSADDAGFTKAGPGTLTLTNTGNDYVGVTTVTGGTLAISTIADGGIASSIGAASSDPANIVLAGGNLAYLGDTTSSDRGITLNTGGGGIEIANSDTTLTLSGVIAGPASLRKNGPGTLVLSGANTYESGTAVNDGILRAGAKNVFGSGSMTVAADALLDLDDFDNAVNGLNGAGDIDLGSATLTVNNGGTFTGTISGTGGLTRAGTNQFTLTLSGCNNTYTGATTINGTSLATDCLKDGGEASGIGASSNDPANLAFSNGTLIYTGDSVTTNRGFTLVSSTGTIDVSNAATTLEFSGDIVGGGALRKNGLGTLVLSGTNSYTGSTRIIQGTLRAASTSALGGGPVTLDNTDGALLDLDGFDNSVSYLTGGGTTGGNISLGDATLTITNGNTLNGANYGGAISGSGNLVKDGGSIQQLSGCDNSYTGTTTILRGTLAVSCLKNGGVDSSIGASTADAGNLVLNGGTLEYIGTGDSTDRQFTLGPSATSALDASGTGAIVFANTAAISFSSPNTAQTINLGGTSTDDNSLAALIANNGTGLTSLTKTDTGTWILTNPGSTYTGVTRINGGVLGVDKLADGGVASSIGASSAAASNLVIGNNSTLRYTGAGDTTNRLFTLSAGVTFIESSGTGPLVFTDTGPVTLAGNNQARTIALGGTNSGNNTLAGSIGDAGTGATTFAKNDAGTWILTGNSTYSGPTNINGGILYLGAGGTTGSITSPTVNDFGTLAFNRSDTLTYAGLITGSGSVLQAGTGTTILTGTDDYTGGTTISAGTLQLGNGGATGSIVGDVANDGVFAFDRNNSYVFGGTISGSGEVDQIGSGTTILTADNSYTGGTTISTGTLQIGNGGTTGSIVGDVTDDSALAFDRLDDISFGGTISGAGSLTKLGAGTLTLTADNSYAGGTTISAGTLQIGDGGATGSIVGDIADNGALVLDRSGTLALDGLISGTGSLTQAGPGTTILTGDNSYGGATNVTAGTLLVDGNQSGTGLTSVSSGATLGGTGTLGGSVTVADGGAINPGDAGGVPGTLSINGDLALSGSSTLNFDFGEANVPGGPLNDLIDVGGDLTLDGTINVAQSPGGTFGPGVYRIINYDGELTDNGLTIGTLPGGTAMVQTSVANQVNLVNTAGLTLNYWDGDAGPKNNNAVNGGDGTWQNAAGNDNWTTFDGSVNAPYTDGAFAIFEGAGGAVTVDDQGGVQPVTASGMQFAADGYTISGDAITLVPDSSGTSSTIHVGDGTAGGASYVATIDSVLQGDTQLVKTDLGTLVLGGANTYTGGTAIDGGTVRIASDDALGDAAGDLSLDGGTLQNTAVMTSDRAVTLGAGGGTFETDADLTLGGTIADGTDPGALTKSGTGTLTLTADETYTGGTTVSAGILQLGNGGGTGSIIGDVADDGTLAFDRNDTFTFDGLISGGGAVSQIGSGTTVLTAANAYTGGTTISDGTLQIGNGGAAGAIVGDVLDDGTLAFDRSDDVTFDGTISGSGNLVQSGTGNLILTADNSYGGATSVGAGGLYINGDQSLATGGTSVASGATLGGKGTIGGNVTLDSGATLSPGDLGAAPGTLTIAGDLTVGGAANLDYSFGQAGVVGGPLNDLTVVHGDLTFQGDAASPALINVTTAPGGTLDPGVYRVISYDGTLVGADGIALGSVPGGTFFVQTSVANQVNLVNAADLTLNFWDGAVGPKGDGTVNGGDGTWEVAGSGDNWTTGAGDVNAPYSNGSFAIFEGAPGAVNVSNDNGAVTASGMQFAVGGYTLGGGTLTLTGPQSIIRVGDGTSDGAGYVATIGNSLGGDTQLVKTDLGTLVLAGTNTYTGGTAINGGTIRISDDANLGDAAGGLSLDGGTLNTTADVASGRTVTLDAGGGTFLTDSGTTTTLSGDITGDGALTKEGTGTLVLTGDATQAGGTTITDGMLQIGAGGLLGSLAGDVTDNATLAFDRSDTYSFDGTISGSGGVTQLGSGTTILTGTNTYAGSTSVAGGTLLVNGDQSGALGLTSVASGATLGGTGTIGGSVILVDGATLSPGGSGNSAGALTINGSLTLSDESILAYNFGQANAPGGALNDVVNVGGDLRLDGTLNVTATDGGSFGPGVYRLFNYDGSLSDSGLTLTSADYIVQTSVANQVNLINTAGQLLNYWDGDAGPKNDGTVDGGDGTWEVAGIGNNWTTPDGVVNAPFSNGDFAVFEGMPGTVSIDNGNGNVTVDGMQFAVDGYTISGDALTLTPDSSGTSTTIRVGDGAADGAAYTATIESDLVGTSDLVKDDLGTLILDGDSTYVGSTTVAAGTLTAGHAGAFNATSDFAVQSGATLDLAGFDQTVASLDNAGAVRLNGAPGTTLTVTGDYVGSGGTVYINTALGDDAAPTDELVVNGNSSGTGILAVTNVGGAGAQTSEGIKLVDVAGTSDATFTLQGDYTFQGDAAVVGGAYAYRLYQGSVSAPADGDWYLRSALIDPVGPTSPLYQAGVPLYEAYANVLQSFNKLPTLQQRVGNRIWSNGVAGLADAGVASDGTIEGNGMWGRIETSRTTYGSGTSTTGTTHADTIWRLQGGVDGLIADTDAGRLIGGVSAQYGMVASQVASAFGDGSIRSTGAGLGGSLTWYGRGGFYLDSQAQVVWYDSTLSSATAGLDVANDNHGLGYSLSVEAGQKIGLDAHWSITPQAQLAYSSVRYDGFTDAFGADVSLQDGNSLTGRLGVSVDYEQQGVDGNGEASRTHLYGIGNVYYETGDGSQTDVAGTSFSNDNDPLWGGVGVGGSYNWGDDKYSIFGEASANTSLSSFSKSYGLSATGGLRVKW